MSLEDLPKDILFSICNYLLNHDLANLIPLNKQICSFFDDDSYWKRRASYSTIETKYEYMNWKCYYREVSRSVNIYHIIKIVIPNENITIPFSDICGIFYLRKISEGDIICVRTEKRNTVGRVYIVSNVTKTNVKASPINYYDNNKTFSFPTFVNVSDIHKYKILFQCSPELDIDVGIGWKLVFKVRKEKNSIRLLRVRDES